MPTITVLAMMKARLQGATKGHALLKKKADALNMRFRMILKKIVQTKEQMGDMMKASFFSLAQAKYASGDFRHSVIDGIDHVSYGLEVARRVGESWPGASKPANAFVILTAFNDVQASIKVKATQDNVAGVKLPKFESFKEGVDSKLGLIGLGSGGKQIQECRCAGSNMGMWSVCAFCP